MKISTVINPKTGEREDRTEYPFEAIREAVLNALIHRDYSHFTEGTPIQIDFFSDRLEIHSPGELYGRMTVEDLGKARPDLRNPALATMAEFLLKTENRYSGIPTIRREMKEAGLPEPEFINGRNEFIVILYNNKRDKNADDDTRHDMNGLLEFCEIPRTRQEIAQYLGIKTLFYVMDRYIQPLLEKGSKAANGMYILSGSSSKVLLENAEESLAGRVNILRMSPLSMREIQGFKDAPFTVDKSVSALRAAEFTLREKNLLEYIVQGMMPQLYDDPDTPKDQFFSDFIETYMQKDLPEVLNVKDDLKYENFLMLLASNTGEELVYDYYAKQIGVSSPTIKEWISSLNKTGIIWLAHPYSSQSIAKRIVKRPKVYFFDTGLACFEAGIRDAESLSKSFLKGRFVETYIANEIRKSYMNNGIDQPVYYYRDNMQNEVDLVIPRNGILSLIECKSGTDYSRADIKAFSCFGQTQLERKTDALICCTEQAYSISETAIALPVSAI